MATASHNSPLHGMLREVLFEIVVSCTGETTSRGRVVRQCTYDDRYTKECSPARAQRNI